MVDQIAALVALGLFQRGKLRDSIRATLEAADAVRRCQVCAGPIGSVRSHFVAVPPMTQPPQQKPITMVATMQAKQGQNKSPRTAGNPPSVAQSSPYAAFFIFL
jgi:hypothetical protein